ncbi:MAG: hypothetical protein ACRECH_18355, partial [Nitrososphaerales archaeon]
TTLEYVYKTGSEARKEDSSIPKFNRDSLKKMMKKAHQTGGMPSPVSSAHVSDRREAARLLISGRSVQGLISSDLSPNLDFEEIVEIDSKIEPFKRDDELLTRLKSLCAVVSDTDTLAEAVDLLINYVAALRKKIGLKDTELNETRSELRKARQNEKNLEFELRELAVQKAGERYWVSRYKKAVEKHGMRLVLLCCRTMEKIEFYQLALQIARKNMASMNQRASDTVLWCRQVVQQTEKWRVERVVEAEESVRHAKELQKAMINSEDLDREIARIILSSPRLLSMIVQMVSEKVLIGALKALSVHARTRIKIAIHGAEMELIHEEQTELNNIVNEQSKRILEESAEALWPHALQRTTMRVQ